MINDIIQTFQYSSPAVIGCLVLIFLLGIVTLGKPIWTLICDIVGGLATLFTLEELFVVVMSAALASVAYYIYVRWG